MEDQVTQELLSRIPTGEELKDPREGDYENAVLKSVEESEDGQAVVLTFTGMRDHEGNSFDQSHRVPLPTRQSEKWQKDMFLALLHDIGAVDRNDRIARYVETPEVKQVVLQMIRNFIGVGYPIRLGAKNGFLNLRIRRKKQQ